MRIINLIGCDCCGVILREIGESEIICTRADIRIKFTPLPFYCRDIVRPKETSSHLDETLCDECAQLLAKKISQAISEVWKRKNTRLPIVSVTEVIDEKAAQHDMPPMREDKPPSGGHSPNVLRKLRLLLPF